MNRPTGQSGRQENVPLTIDRDNATDQAKSKWRGIASSFSVAPMAPMKPPTVKTDGGWLRHGSSPDQRRPAGGQRPDGRQVLRRQHLEVWKIKNGGNGWSHPVHAFRRHHPQPRRQGTREWEKWAQGRVSRWRRDRRSEQRSALPRVRRYVRRDCRNTQHETFRVAALGY